MQAVVWIDSREKKNQHITKRLDELNIQYQVKKLFVGDYSFIWNGIDYSNKVVVERKQNFSEIIGNFTKGRERFKREFERAKGCRVILVIEEPESHLDKHLYRSRMSPKDVKSFFNTWCNKFQLTLKFTDKDKSADLILQCFRDFIINERCKNEQSYFNGQVDQRC
jgi:ERCC4-type nuclease